MIHLLRNGERVGDADFSARMTLMTNHLRLLTGLTMLIVFSIGPIGAQAPESHYAHETALVAQTSSPAAPGVAATVLRRRGDRQDVIVIGSNATPFDLIVAESQLSRIRSIDGDIAAIDVRYRVRRLAARRMPASSEELQTAARTLNALASGRQVELTGVGRARVANVLLPRVETRKLR